MGKKKKYRYRFGDLTLMVAEYLLVGVTLGLIDEAIKRKKKRLTHPA